MVRIAVRDHEPSTDRELLEQRGWWFRRARRDADRLVRCVDRPAERAVAVMDVHVVEAESREPFRGAGRELGDTVTTSRARDESTAAA